MRHNLRDRILLRAGQRQLFALRIKERHARLNRNRASCAVDRQIYGYGLDA
jgi:hypothetical protein